MKGKLTMLCRPVKGAKISSIVIDGIKQDDVQSVLADQYEVKLHHFKPQ